MTNARTRDSNQSAINQEVLSTEECAEVISIVQQLRTKAGLAADQEISIYVTDAQMIRSTLAEMGDQIREQTNAIDVVRVNVKAGNPMPAHLPQVELHNLDDGPATIAIEKS